MKEPATPRPTLPSEIAQAAVDAWKNGARVVDLVKQYGVDRTALGTAMLRILGGRDEWNRLRILGAGGGPVVSRIRASTAVVSRARTRPRRVSEVPSTALSAESCRWALSEAVSQWSGDEGRAHERLSGAVLTRQGDFEFFCCFLRQWGIARHTTADAKRLIFTAFVREWRPLWSDAKAGNAEAFESVEHAAAHVKESHWSDSRLTSLSSKLAFMTNPLVFAPYDQTARRALRLRGLPVKNHDYRGYMAGFLAVLDANAGTLRQMASDISHSEGRGMSPDLFQMRLLDKTLMHEGGFRPRKPRVPCA